MKRQKSQVRPARTAAGTRSPRRGFAVGALATATLFLAGAQVGQAATLTAQEDVTKFGRINQSDVSGGVLGNGGNSCAPTATMNSFMYLQNTSQAVLGNDGMGNPILQGGQGSWTAAAIQLALNMGTTGAGGTGTAGWMAGKTGWFSTYAPMAPMNFAGMGVAGGPAWMNAAAPTPAFLYSQLAMGEDIELGILPGPGGGAIGHVLTVTGITWDNVAGTYTLNTIDPANPAGNTPLSVNAAGNVTGANYNGYSVAVAMAESVPDASTTFGLLFLGVGALGLLHYRATRAGAKAC